MLCPSCTRVETRSASVCSYVSFNLMQLYCVLDLLYTYTHTHIYIYMWLLILKLATRKSTISQVALTMGRFEQLQLLFCELSCTGIVSVVTMAGCIDSLRLQLNALLILPSNFNFPVFSTVMVIQYLSPVKLKPLPSFKPTPLELSVCYFLPQPYFKNKKFTGWLGYSLKIHKLLKLINLKLP